MAATIERRHAPAFHPVHLLLLGGAFSLFLGGLLSDIGYARSYEIQWQNFASWLIAGALMVTGGALVSALAGLAPSRRTRGTLLHFLLLLATWIVGCFNALMHARDAWASMPGGLVLSVATALLALVAIVFAARTGGVA